MSSSERLIEVLFVENDKRINIYTIIAKEQIVCS